MTWLISAALMRDYESSRCSQGQAVESLAGTCSDGKPFAQLNVMPTQHPFWRNDKMTDFSRPSLFGLTCAVLTEDHTEAVLTWCLADSRAKTYRSPEVAQDSTERAADCGQSLRGSLARYDPTSHSLKTAQDSLFSDLTECSVILPRSGSMRNGMCYQRPILERPTIETGCGLLRETFPTPTVCGNYNRKGASATSGDGLATYVRKFPTPTASAYKGWSPNHNRADTDDRIDYTIEREAHELGQPGRLNPMWEEWLMAWPIGWTQLKPLAMDKFRLWQQQHSPCYAHDVDGNGADAAG